jgi:orotidine-5'-phosphate decarboxylase
MRLARRLQGIADLLKVGSKLFTAEGPRAVQRLAATGAEIFLDLKFHDIPNTVAGAVAAAAELPRVRLLTLHTSGGLAMMRAAREALRGSRRRPALLGVTILTSLDISAMRQIGLAGTARARAVALALLAREAGLDGIVASAEEIPAIRRACGPDFLTLIPAVRPANTATNDQSRIATPAEATRSGANFLVVGRPITAARDPRAAAQAIAREIATASCGRR